jgi:hypothetical protein
MSTVPMNLNFVFVPESDNFKSTLHELNLWEILKHQIYRFIKSKTPNSDQSRNTSRKRNECANTYPRTSLRWDQVPRMSKHPLLTGHIRCDPSFLIMNA